MNNFPAMTEEQRQELIEFIQGSRTYRYEEWSRLSKLRDQITLAALTAKSIAWIETGTDGFQRGSRLINYFTSDIQGFDNGTLIYTAPPAPVLRVPDGWALVPVEPTEDMLAAAKEWFGLTTTAEGVYEKMLGAAPEASNEQSNQQRAAGETSCTGNHEGAGANGEGAAGAS